MNKILIFYASPEDISFVTADRCYNNLNDFLTNVALPSHTENFEMRFVSLEDFEIDMPVEEFLFYYNLCAYDYNPVETNGSDVAKWVERLRTIDYFWERAEKNFSFKNLIVEKMIAS